MKPTMYAGQPQDSREDDAASETIEDAAVVYDPYEWYRRYNIALPISPLAQKGAQNDYCLDPQDTEDLGLDEMVLIEEQD